MSIRTPLEMSDLHQPFRPHSRSAGAAWPSSRAAFVVRGPATPSRRDRPSQALEGHDRLLGLVAGDHPSTPLCRQGSRGRLACCWRFSVVVLRRSRPCPIAVLAVASASSPARLKSARSSSGGDRDPAGLPGPCRTLSGGQRVGDLGDAPATASAAAGRRCASPVGPGCHRGTLRRVSTTASPESSIFRSFNLDARGIAVWTASSAPLSGMSPSLRGTFEQRLRCSLRGHVRIRGNLFLDRVELRPRSEVKTTLIGRPAPYPTAPTSFATLAFSPENREPQQGNQQAGRRG